MTLEGTETIVGSLKSCFHQSDLCTKQTTRDHYYIIYKEHELDIGSLSLDAGLMKALKWFGEIVFKEAKNGLE
jgi:hypothetical protein